MKWRLGFVSTKCTDFYAVSVKDIIQCMKQKKITCDHEEKLRKKVDKNPNKCSRYLRL